MDQNSKKDEMCVSSLMLFGCEADSVVEYRFIFDILKMNIKMIYKNINICYK